MRRDQSAGKAPQQMKEELAFTLEALRPEVPARADPSGNGMPGEATFLLGHPAEITHLDDLRLSRGHLRERCERLIQGQNGSMRRARQEG